MSGDEVEQVRAALLASVREVCGDEALSCHPSMAKLLAKASTVLRTSNTPRTSQYVSRLPTALFARLLAHHGTVSEIEPEEPQGPEPEAGPCSEGAVGKEWQLNNASDHGCQSLGVSTTSRRPAPRSGTTVGGTAAEEPNPHPHQQPLKRAKTPLAGQQQKQQQRNLQQKQKKQKRLIITTFTEFGREKRRCYEDAGQLARAIVEDLDGRGQALLAFAGVNKKHEIEASTHLYVAKQHAHDMLLCRDCGHFCTGLRGLRDHQQCFHKHTYERSKESAQLSNAPIVPYQAGTALQHLVQQWRREAKQQQEKAKALHPVLQAAKEGQFERLQQMHTEGIDVHTVDRHGSNVLHWAAGGGHLGMCRWFVDVLGASPTHTQPSSGRNALHWAARNGHVEVCAYLVKRGVDVNAGTTDGTPPLHWAVWQNHAHVCDFLVSRGADVHALNAFGCNAVQWAAQAGHRRMCEWLKRHGVRFQLLNNNGHSAFHKAAIYGHAHVCRWLHEEGGLGLEHLGSDVDGNTPMEMARLDGHTEAFEYLQDLHNRLAKDKDMAKAALARKPGTDETSQIT